MVVLKDEEVEDEERRVCGGREGVLSRLPSGKHGNDRWARLD